MRVLMITGDKNFGSGHPRFELQRRAVNELAVVYWGRGSIWPHIPTKKFDVATVQDPFWRGLFAWYIARRNGISFNVQVHTDLQVQPFLKHMLAQMVLRHADGIRVVSEKLKRQVEVIGVHAPISVLPVFVDVSKFSSVTRKKHSYKNILWIGRFEEEKNPIEAIRILEKVMKTVPDVRMTMLGDGRLKENAIQEANNLPIVEILGYQNPVTYLGTADVVLCTSWHESFGVSIVEALAAGVPVVAPDVGVAREAGAIIATQAELAETVVEVLQTGASGHLQLHMLSAEEWTKLWKKTLVETGK